ncbi:uncharacterized protein K444DRAFT_633402 [Hyaloscypha bicolor E]|uniref:Uncharacterized protein n=1 Tax=Hyaloscypha bicolor E TaxID=1095630 RepID=A0A2J6SYM2_9HELO|nr:uncharacterized protein K444DRAFT_633402 [Hyaloscypha bicolor E]PMD55875.1 hypothetical protein K444DRAFT_633402 [Hyaloscypha bicolor E]
MYFKTIIPLILHLLTLTVGPPEQYVAKGEKAGDLNMTKKKLGKISESWLSENASRRRALTGMYRMEDLADCARFLQRKLVAGMTSSMSTDESFLAKSNSSTANYLV